MVASSKVIRVGPWGGRGGSPWDDGAHRGVRSITVAYGRSLESMTVEYVDRNGRPVHGEKHGGGTSRSRTEKIELEYPYEFVTGVSGSYREAHGGSLPVVRSLTFTTSRGKVHGPFGYDDQGMPFAYPMEGGVVVGFTGRSSWHVDALGLYVAALRPETICDAVQERGLTAYRTFVYGGSGITRPPRGRSSGATNTYRTFVYGGSGSGARHHHQNQTTKRPFEWCYK
ncbi:hypothetical protein PR202_gb05030 [Eleusine coracana subsp. coracana]|uniref:Jacalin-type lectin domain-containing protein n=1 Tax=Eleusine coracana subsp. coracana TaxID=191504 RepID=A0AAV5E665_ELECO|nr:hypothetical protein PR202_gb05030 [Eleusine coracana subsp. coracana]